MKRRTRLFRVPSIFALIGLVAACSEVGTENPAEPIIPEAPQLNPEILSAAWTFDVDGVNGDVYVTAPSSGLDGLSQSIIADHFGLEPGHPQLSIVGGDVVELTPSNLDFGVPRALPGVGSGFVRDVSWEVGVRNLITGIELSAPTFPDPPAGTTNPVLIPFNQVVTVTSGSVDCELGATGGTSDCFIEAPSEGNVFVSDAGGVNSGGNGFNSGYQGPPHNFFNDTPCEPTGTFFGQGDQSDCRPFRELPSNIAGGATVGPVVVNYTIDQTVNLFRAQILLAADISDGTPDTSPPTINSITQDGPARLGEDITLTGDATDDRTVGPAIAWAWDLDGGSGTGPFDDATGNPAAFTCTAIGSFTVGAEATDAAGNSTSATQTVECVANAAPTVGFIGEPYSGPVNSTVTIDAGASTDDVSIATYEVQIDGGGFGTPQASPQFPVVCPATPQTLTVDVRVTDSPEGAQTTGSTTVECTPPPNIFLVWTDGAGNEITSVSAGTTVTLQICTTEDVTQAFQANLSYDVSLASQDNAGTDLNSVTAGVGACANSGGSDVIDQFTGGLIQSPFNFQTFALTASQGSGVVGLAAITFTASNPGSLTPGLAVQVWSSFGGVPLPTPVVGASTLEIQ